MRCILKEIYISTLWRGVRRAYQSPCCVWAKSLQLCATLCDLMDCSPPGSAVHGILQARILEWVAVSSFKWSSQPRDRTWVSYVSCIGRWVLYPYCHLGNPNWLWYVEDYISQHSTHTINQKDIITHQNTILRELLEWDHSIQNSVHATLKIWFWWHYYWIICIQQISPINKHAVRKK